MSYANKDQIKFSICSQVFGYGVQGSTSYAYNTGVLDYVHADQVIGISIDSNRPNRLILSEAWVKHFTRLRCAIVTDNEYHRNRSYNVGERELAEILLSHDYEAIDKKERAIWYHKDDIKEFRNPTPKTAKFRDDLYFLDNMYPCIVNLEDYQFYCAEAAYQACKDPDNVQKYTEMDGYTAKKNAVKATQEFHQDKVSLMVKILTAKFSNPYLKEMLIQIDDKDLVEENNWNDTFWGTCKGKGENHLGKILKYIKYSHLQKELTPELEVYNLWY